MPNRYPLWSCSNTGTLRGMDAAQKQQKQQKRVPGRPFPKGVSGNPRGKPPLTPEAREARALQRRAIASVRDEMARHLDLACDAILELATNPGVPEATRLAAAKEIIDRVEGRTVAKGELKVEDNRASTVVSADMLRERARALLEQQP